MKIERQAMMIVLKKDTWMNLMMLMLQRAKKKDPRRNEASLLFLLLQAAKERELASDPNQMAHLKYHFRGNNPKHHSPLQHQSDEHLFSPQKYTIQKNYTS